MLNICPTLICSALLWGSCSLGLGATSIQGNGTRGHRGPTETNMFHLAVPAQDYDLILARPEDHSVVLSVLAYRDLEGFVAYGTQPSGCTNQMPMQTFKAGMPVELKMEWLKADTDYRYEFHSRNPGAALFANSKEFSFHTARPAGSSFGFTMTADAHLDERTSSEVYLQTLANIRADKPDFHIDLGNLFMTDKHARREEAAQQYLAQRFYLGQIGSSVPVFLALGVHDGEGARDDDNSSDCLAVWSNLVRKRYFPAPVPDAFYTGDTVSKPYRDLLQNYYAWEWGDALFIVLDPFGYSTRQRGGDDGWGWSLGRAQYDWLNQTLARSKARYKFVFIHNLLCGDQAARGGVEVAAFNEWGGKNPDGSDGFKQHRPGWDLPIHQVLVRNHVTAVFKAHDNFYAHQELDRIVYLMVPQPSFAGDDRIRDLQAYGYRQGTFIGNSGHVRVSVSPEKVIVAYIKASPGSPAADAFAITAR
jgi:hypothetical protein